MRHGEEKRGTVDTVSGLLLIGSIAASIGGVAVFLLLFIPRFNIYWLILAPVIIACYQIPAVLLFGAYKRRRRKGEPEEEGFEEEGPEEEMLEEERPGEERLGKEALEGEEPGEGELEEVEFERGEPGKGKPREGEPEKWDPGEGGGGAPERQGDSEPDSTPDT